MEQHQQHKPSDNRLKMYKLFIQVFAFTFRKFNIINKLMAAARRLLIESSDAFYTLKVKDLCDFATSGEL